MYSGKYFLSIMSRNRFIGYTSPSTYRLNLCSDIMRQYTKQEFETDSNPDDTEYSKTQPRLLLKTHLHNMQGFPPLDSSLLPGSTELADMFKCFAENQVSDVISVRYLLKTADKKYAPYLWLTYSKLEVVPLTVSELQQFLNFCDILRPVLARLKTKYRNTPKASFILLKLVDLSNIDQTRKKFYLDSIPPPSLETNHKFNEFWRLVMSMCGMEFITY